MKVIKIALIVATIVTVALLVRLIMLGRESQNMQVALGIKDGRLTPCPPGSLNCAESKSPSDAGLKPMLIDSNPIARLEEILTKHAMVIQDSKENYIYATDKSKLFGFVDDIEFYYTPGQLHFRSSSRVGKNDLGANKKRLNMILSELKL